MMNKTLCCLLLVLAAAVLRAQEKTAMDYIDRFQEYEFSDTVKAKACLVKALELAQTSKDRKALARAHRAWGWYYEDRRMLARSLEEHLRSTEMYRSLGDKQGEADGYGNMGIVYDELYDFKKATKAHYRSAALYDLILRTTKDTAAIKAARRGMSVAYGNLGSIYSRMDEVPKAIDLHMKAMHIEQELNDQDGLRITYANLGIAYREIKNMKLSRYYHGKALYLKKKLGDVYSQPSSYINLAVLYNENNSPDTALLYLDSAARISLRTGNRQSLSYVYSNMATAFRIKGDVKRARELSEKALELAEHEKDLNHSITITRQLAGICAENKKYERAYALLNRYIELKDTLDASDFEKEMVREAVNFDFTQRIVADSLRKSREDALRALEHRQEIRQQRIYLYYGIGAFLVTAVFLLYMFRANRQKKRINSELARKNDIIGQQHREARHQKEIIEEKQKEIIDSINYAKRIQTAILAEEEEVRKFFPASFLLYRPKDIVAGDFYFFETSATHVFYAAADCTGHGVPGALVSVVCANALTRCVKEFGLTEPGEILDRTRQLVTDTFGKSGKEVRDGMDISLLSVGIDALGQWNSGNSGNAGTCLELRWAGANNALWVVDATGSLTEIKPDKQPIGFTDSAHPFTTHVLNVSRDTCLYLFTDGYADQFGGENQPGSKAGGKKLKSKNLQELIRQLYGQNMVMQGRRLEEYFDAWKGSLEQADDVCIIGIKV